jgi:hypothetical protein
LEKKTKISKKYARMMEFREEIERGGGGGGEESQRRGWCMDPTHTLIVNPFILPKTPYPSPPPSGLKG